MRRGSVDADALMPAIPSVAQKKAAAAAAAQQEYFEQELASVEAERATALERATLAEGRCTELEQQRDETAAAVEKQVAELSERAAQRESQLLGQLQTQERAAQDAAKAAADHAAALEADKLSLIHI